MSVVDPDLSSLTSVLESTDARLSAPDPSARVWPTGFALLDTSLNGGLRGRNLILLAGQPGLGKTTFALQMARNVARTGRQVLYFCYEHEGEWLLTRLLAMEADESDVNGPPLPLEQITQLLDDTEGGDLVQRLAGTTRGIEALKAVSAYAPNLHIHRSTGRHTNLDVIAAAIEDVTNASGEAPFVVVDYLQKVPVPEGSVVESERVTMVVEGLKDLALAADVPILAIVAADKEGFEVGKRLRSHHLRGSTALAYEADVLLALADKGDVVARHHLVYGAGSQTYGDWLVLTIEKNRSGRAGIDMQFRKRLAHSRFSGDGERITETLVDDRVYVE